MQIPKHIVVATDFSPASEPALDAAAALAREIGAKVSLIHVFDPMPLVPPAAIPRPERMEGAIEEEMREKIVELLEEMKAERLEGLECEVAAVNHDSAALGLCEWAEEHGADLVVVGTHGRTGLRRLLIGSVAERVVRHCHCPVLAVPPGDED